MSLHYIQFIAVVLLTDGPGARSIVCAAVRPPSWQRKKVLGNGPRDVARVSATPKTILAPQSNASAQSVGKGLRAPGRETPRTPGTSFADVGVVALAGSGLGGPNKTHKDADEHEHDEQPRLTPGVKEQESHAGFVAGVMLLTFAISLMGILFLLHYPDPQVHSYSYKLVSHIISILCALMFEKSQDQVLMRGVIIPLFGLGHGLNELWCFVPFFLVYFSIRPLCHYCRNSPNRLFAVESIVAHLAAFIAIEMVNEPLEHTANAHDTVVHVLLYVAAPVLVVPFFKIFSKASASVWKLDADDVSGSPSEEYYESQHQGLEPETATPPAFPSREHHGHTDEGHAHEGEHHHHTWHHCVEKAECEVSAIVFGFLIKELGEQIIGAMLGRSKYDDVHKGEAVVGMIIFTLVLGAGYMLLIAGRETVKNKLGEETFETMQDHATMSISWCVTTASKWTTYWCLNTRDESSSLKSFTVRKMVNAIWLTPATIIVVLWMDSLADAGRLDDYRAEGIIACCGLVTGIAWEQCYASAVKTVATETPHATTLVQNVITFCLVGALVPGWLKFIVPTALLPVPKRESATADATADSATRETVHRLFQS